MIPRSPRLDLPDDWCAMNDYDPVAIEQIRQRTVFYDNHLNQLRSYIYAIPDYGPMYGYLVYWRYSLPDRDNSDRSYSYSLQCEQIRARKISGINDAERNEIREVYTRLMNAMREGGGHFDATHRSPSKCAGCVHGVLCGHKMGLFDRYTFPYDRRYLETKRVPFPDELRKQKGEFLDHN
jgi:hypothetical protein